MPLQPEGSVWPIDGALEPGAAQGNSPFAAYVHVPFCTVRCGYCDFNTYTTGFGEGADLETYADAVIREIEFSGSILSRRALESVFLVAGPHHFWLPKQ